jgi:hypothetical protein
MKKEDIKNEEIEVVVSAEEQAQIDAVENIKRKYASDTTKNVKKVYYIEVQDEDDEDNWVGAYFGKPTLKLFSQFSKNSPKDRINALKVLLVNLFLEGDRRLIEDDDYFLSAMSQIEGVVNVQQARIKKF